MLFRIGEKPAVERFHSGLFAAFSAFFQEMEFELRQQFRGAQIACRFFRHKAAALSIHMKLGLYRMVAATRTQNAAPKTQTAVAADEKPGQLRIRKRKM